MYQAEVVYPDGSTEVRKFDSYFAFANCELICEAAGFGFWDITEYPEELPF